MRKALIVAGSAMSAVLVAGAAIWYFGHESKCANLPSYLDEAIDAKNMLDQARAHASKKPSPAAEAALRVAEQRYAEKSAAAKRAVEERKKSQGLDGGGSVASAQQSGSCGRASL